MQFIYAIEFQANVKDCMIKIPPQHKEQNLKHLKIIELLDDSLDVMTREDKTLFSDEFINENIVTLSTDPMQDDDAVLQEEYGDYLSAK